jgi:hypothetical protein
MRHRRAYRFEKSLRGLRLTQSNNAAEPTAVGRFSSAVAGCVAGRLWLSFIRWGSTRHRNPKASEQKEDYGRQRKGEHDSEAEGIEPRGNNEALQAL